MRYINSFNIFERKSDFNRISDIENLYTDIFNNIHTKSKYDDYIFTQGRFFFLLMDFHIPMVISFDKERKHASFGKIQINDGVYLPCIYLTYKEYNGIENGVSLMINYSSNKSDVIHELTHLIDVINHGEFQSIPINKTQPEWNSKDIKNYYNHAYERNAFFIESYSKILTHIKRDPSILTDFDIFLSYMKLGGSGEAFKNMTDKNKKKFISRCYILYDTLNKK